MVLQDLHGESHLYFSRTDPYHPEMGVLAVFVNLMFDVREDPSRKQEGERREESKCMHRLPTGVRIVLKPGLQGAPGPYQQGHKEKQKEGTEEE